MNALTILFISLFILSLYDSSTQTNILELKNNPNFKETVNCSRTITNNIQINIKVSYNVKNSVDEEYSHSLRLILPHEIDKDTIIKIEMDNKSIQCNYQFSSTWYWPQKERPNNVTGTIKILKIKSKSLTIDFDIMTMRIRDEKKLVYKGERKIKM